MAKRNSRVVRARQPGFTLLELLVSFAVVSILAVIAVPVYFGYATRAKVSEGVALLGPVQDRIIEEFYVTGAWPTSNAEARLPPPESYESEHVAQIGIQGAPGGAQVTVVYRIPALGAANTLVYTPLVGADSGGVGWECTGGSMINKYRPPVCRTPD